MLSWDSELAGCGKWGQILGSSIFPWTLGFFNCRTCVSIWSPWLAIPCAPGVASLIDNTYFVLGEVQRCMLWPPPSGTISSDLTKITVTPCYWGQVLSALWTLSPNSRGICFCFKLLCFPGSSAGKKNPPAMQETWLQSQGWEDPPEKGMDIHWTFKMAE